MKFRSILWAGLFWIGLSAAALATYIRMETTVTSTVEGDALRVIISTVNRGDEPAYNIQAEIKVLGKKASGKKKPDLSVNGTYRTEESFPLSSQKSGTYPLIAMLNYTDANQYPFSALTCQTFTVGQAKESPLFGQAWPLSISREGTLRFTLRNLGEKEAGGSTALVLPRELMANPEIVPFTIPSGGQKDFRVVVRNFSALPGSTYQVFLISEFEGGLHHTRITPVPITVSSTRRGLFGVSYPVLILVLGLLLAVFIAMQFLKKK